MGEGAAAKKKRGTKDRTSTVSLSGLEAIWYSKKQAGTHQDLRDLFLNWFYLDFFARFKIDKDSEIPNLSNIRNKFTDSKKLSR
jgi:hypothetical protein